MIFTATDFLRHWTRDHFEMDLVDQSISNKYSQEEEKYILLPLIHYRGNIIWPWQYQNTVWYYRHIRVSTAG